MKRLAVFFILCGAAVVCCLKAQNNQDITYLILTSKSSVSGKTIKEGIQRSTRPKDSLRISDSFSFYIISEKRGINERFSHINYNKEKRDAYLRRMNLDPADPNDYGYDIKVKPRSFLDSITPIDLDVILPKMTAEELLNIRGLRGKNIYIIDRNDMTKDSLKLIKVRLRTSVQSPIPEMIKRYWEEKEKRR